MKKLNIFLLLCNIILLIFAIFEIAHSKEFFSFLKIFITISSGYLAINTTNKNIKYIFISVAILFNPILQIYLEKNIWILLDLLVMYFFIYYLLLETIGYKKIYNYILNNKKKFIVLLILIIYLTACCISYHTSFFK